MPTTEPTVNVNLATVLRETRRMWRESNSVKGEETQVFTDGKRPDILIMEAGTSPVVIETEFHPARTVEADAKSRLGKKLDGNGMVVLSAVAVKLPMAFKDVAGTSLLNAIQAEKSFGFACFAGTSPEQFSRWPENGWMTGSVSDLSVLAQYMTVPPPVIDEAANLLVTGIIRASGKLEEAASRHPTAVSVVEKLLKQKDCTQTRRMAMTIVANAMLLHGNLAGRTEKLSQLKPLVHLLSGSHVSQAAILEEWQKILNVNYFPIMDIAKKLVETIPPHAASSILGDLALTAQEMLERGLTQSHDLVGGVFQKLISDRKFLAAYYTRPSSAALLARLAVSSDKTPNGGEWGSLEDIQGVKIGDFACGTGTLLSTTYKMVRLFYELRGGDESQAHHLMMSGSLVGCDIMPSAVHITASMLSSANPSVTYEDTSIMTMPYGKQQSGEICLGSLDLLQSQGAFPALATRASRATAMGEKKSDTWKEIPDGSFDLVIMNPPFTRPTNHEGDRADVPNPMFAAFENSTDEQRIMAKMLPPLTRGTCYDGNAGEATAFLALADRKLKAGATLAIVLELTLLVGSSWRKSRDMLVKGYNDIRIITIAGRSHKDSSFSADTKMAECLLIARKSATNSKAAKRATFITLRACPKSDLEGFILAEAIQSLRATCREIDAGPIGGTDILVGSDFAASMISIPLSEGDIWPVGRVADMQLAQSAFQLVKNNRIWLPGMEKRNAVGIQLAQIGQIATVGPIDRDITGTERQRQVTRGPFEQRTLVPGQEPTYPMLWAHDAEREHAVVVEPDSQGALRRGSNNRENEIIREKAERIWRTASRCHFNIDFQYNSQSLVCAYTEKLCIGGRAWPSVKFRNVAQDKAFALWSNSTLGILCHWWHANRAQNGRGSVKTTSIASIPCLDVTLLTPNQLAMAVKSFDSISRCHLKPVHEIVQDEVRSRIDRLLLVDLLGMHESVLDHLALLKQKFSLEPSVEGGKNVPATSNVERAARNAPRSEEVLVVNPLYASNVSMVKQVRAVLRKEGLADALQVRRGKASLKIGLTYQDKVHIRDVVARSCSGELGRNFLVNERYSDRTISRSRPRRSRV